ncbi:MAG: hypothetical protein CMI16_00690 [Opitutaceae bacterium]|nr:hypothetical protein [Opitutaceae bacterium]
MKNWNSKRFNTSEWNSDVFWGGDQHVGILLSDSCPKKSTKACLDNRKRCDYDVLVTRGRKMSVDQFADFLTGEMAKFKKT